MHIQADIMDRVFTGQAEEVKLILKNQEEVSSASYYY
jgi:hypothetical protein